MKQNPNNISPCERVDQGPDPFIANLLDCTLKNNNFQTALWTGDTLQLTLMTIQPKSEIGPKCHPDFDQLLYVGSGSGFAMMGKQKYFLDYKYKVVSGCIIIIPKNIWYQLINIEDSPIKLFSVCAPPQCPHGTVYRKEEHSCQTDF